VEALEPLSCLGLGRHVRKWRDEGTEISSRVVGNRWLVQPLYATFAKHAPYVELGERNTWSATSSSGVRHNALSLVLHNFSTCCCIASRVHVSARSLGSSCKQPIPAYCRKRQPGMHWPCSATYRLHSRWTLRFEPLPHSCTALRDPCFCVLRVSSRRRCVLQI
jgi:hypothetical protein